LSRKSQSLLIIVTCTYPPALGKGTHSEMCLKSELNEIKRKKRMEPEKEKGKTWYVKPN